MRRLPVAGPEESPAPVVGRSVDGCQAVLLKTGKRKGASAEMTVNAVHIIIEVNEIMPRAPAGADFLNSRRILENRHHPRDRSFHHRFVDDICLTDSGLRNSRLKVVNHHTVGLFHSLLCADRFAGKVAVHLSFRQRIRILCRFRSRCFRYRLLRRFRSRCLRCRLLRRRRCFCHGSESRRGIRGNFIRVAAAGQHGCRCQQAEDTCQSLLFHSVPLSVRPDSYSSKIPNNPVHFPVSMVIIHKTHYKASRPE